MALKKLTKKIAALLAAACLLLLSACSSQQDAPSPGYSSQAELNNTPAYYRLYTFDNNQLSYSTQPIYIGNEGKYEAIANALMERDNCLRDGYKGVFSSSVELRSIRRQGDVLYINFSDELRYEQPLAVAKMISSLANTFTALEEINYVSIGCEGRQLSIPGYDAHPVMAFDAEADDPQAIVSNWESVQNAFESGSFYKEEAYVPLYFRASSSGGVYVPEVRRITFKGTDYADQIINQLILGPATEGYSVFENNITLFEPSSYDGQTLSIRFLARDSYPVQDQLWVAVPALALTLYHLYPTMQNIAVEILVQTAEDYDSVYSYSSEISGFLSLIRTNLRCYFPNESFSGLTARTTAVYAYDELTASRELLAGILEGQTGGMAELKDLLSPQEDILYSEAVLSLYRTGECLNINFSQAFHEALGVLSYEQERCLAYAIVNTLCFNSGFEEVRFLADGAPVETFGRYISALRPLIPDYGILVS